MTTATDYLRAEKTDELVSQLKGEGYEVADLRETPGAVFDVIAAKNGRKIAYKVKANSELKEALPEIQALRRLSRSKGYHDFRLVVVAPPRTIEATVENLPHTLREYLSRHPFAPLKALSPSPRIERVAQVDLDRLLVTRSGVQVAGTGVVEVQFGNDGDRNSGALDDFPFRFDLTLDHNLSITAEHQLELLTDVSEYADAGGVVG